MKIKLLFYFIIILFLFVKCNEDKKGSTVIINPETFQSKVISLSQIVDSIKYIPLDNQVQVSALYDVKIDETYLYCASPQGIMLYNTDGKFIRRIGKIGRGPNEYIYGNHIAINENHDIIVLDLNRLLIYSVSGEIKRIISLDDFGFHYGDVEYNKGQIFLAESFVGQNKHDWMKMDTIGQVLEEKINPLPSFFTNIGYKIRLFKFDNKVHYWNHYNDTIYEIETINIKLEFLFANGNFRIPKERVKDNVPYFIPLRIMETKRYLILEYLRLNIYYLSVYDKYIKEFFIVSSTEISEKEEFPVGFINDYDDGIPFNPDEYFLIGNSEYLLSWVDPFNLISTVESRTIKNSSPKFPEKKKQLEQLATSLDKNDNPVLMLVKLKE